MIQSRFPEYEIPGGRQHHQFNPYEDNGGSIVAIAGDDFAVIGADTRLSSGYSIHTRAQSKLFPMAPKTVLASAGCWADSLEFVRVLRARMQMYEKTHNKPMSTNAVAQLSSILMYSRRFFPYYVSNMLAGIDSDGKGRVYSYDPVGHCTKTTYCASGSSGALLQPMLDNQVAHLNQTTPKPPLTQERAIDLVRDLFISAAERDIHCGDAVTVTLITAAGSKSETYPLRRD